MANILVLCSGDVCSLTSYVCVCREFWPLIVIGQLTTLSSADWRSQILPLKLHFNTFQNELFGILVTKLAQQYIGENIGLSPNNSKCVQKRLFDIFIHKKHPNLNLIFWFFVFYPETLTSPSSAGDQILLENLQSNFFNSVLLFPSLSIA